MNHIVIDTVYVFSRNQSKSEQNVSIHIITMCKCMLKVKTAPKHPSLRFENQCMLEGEWMSWNRHACGCDMLKCYALTYIGVFEKSNKLYVLAKKTQFPWISWDLIAQGLPRCPHVNQLNCLVKLWRENVCRTIRLRSHCEVNGAALQLRQILKLPDCSILKEHFLFYFTALKPKQVKNSQNKLTGKFTASLTFPNFPQWIPERVHRAIPNSPRYKPSVRQIVNSDIILMFILIFTTFVLLWMLWMLRLGADCFGLCLLLRLWLLGLFAHACLTGGRRWHRRSFSTTIQAAANEGNSTSRYCKATDQGENQVEQHWGFFVPTVQSCFWDGLLLARIILKLYLPCKSTRNHAWWTRLRAGRRQSKNMLDRTSWIKTITKFCEHLEHMTRGAMGCTTGSAPCMKKASLASWIRLRQAG